MTPEARKVLIVAGAIGSVIATAIYTGIGALVAAWKAGGV